MVRFFPQQCLFPAALALSLAANAVHAETEDAVTPDQVVGAIEGAYGVTRGQRRNHTRGTCAIGEFVGIPNGYSRSILFSGEPIPVVARFSVAGGNPAASDTNKSPRGMALEFRLPNGVLQHMTMLNTPVFGAAQPQTFLDMMVAAKPDPETGKPDPEKMKAFRESHLDSLAQADFLSRNNPPPNYANSAFYGIHAFKFISGTNMATMVRWRFIPQDGEKRLSDAQLKSMPRAFLEQELIKRTQDGPVRWDMVISIGKAGDPVDNPTVEWPADRKQMKVGTFTITAAMPQKGAPCENINYDPLVMADGIEPSNDPILLFRSAAYAVSFARRMGGN